MSTISSVRVKSEASFQKDSLTKFFENHPTIRKIVAYGPIIFFGVGHTIERFSSYKLFPENSVSYMISVVMVFAFSEFARSCERSLQNKEIEHLNKPKLRADLPKIPL